MLGGVPGVAPAKADIIGGGAVGTHATRTATEIDSTLLAVPGVHSIHRMRRSEVFEIALGGEIHTMRFPNEPRFAAVYEIEHPDVIASSAWAKAVDKRRWSTMVTPF